ncbi:MAG TPA: hypothetical protein VE571_13755 [Solirubrobacteraceae bacterium]|nr:hypothetical protein [Solirubrobacteraceae bacterium]
MTVATSPLTQRELLDLYFLDARARLLDLAAFLDRLERGRDSDAEADFRLVGLRAAVALLDDGQLDRVRRIQLALSDPTLEPQLMLDRKGASGAFDPDRRGL